MLSLRLLLVTVLCVFNMSAQEKQFPLYRVNNEHYNAPENVSLYYWNKQFWVLKGETGLQIDPTHIDKEIRDIEPENLSKALQHGRMIVKQTENDEYVLQYRIQAKGGGLILAIGTWWAVQVGCYSTVLIGTLLVNTGLPGLGTLTTSLALGTGGLAGLHLAINAAATKAAILALTLPTP